MKTLLAVATLLLVTACGNGTVDHPVSATDPTPTARNDAPPVPAAPGAVSTRLVTVMDTGTPEVCLGPVAESWPPQCSGPELVDWDWADHRQMYERQGDVRWGQFALTGTWDGERLTVRSAVPAALYDAMPVPSLAVPIPRVEHTRTELRAIADEAASIPGAAGSGYVRGHNVIVSVVYDDGTLQRWADERWGDRVVFLVPQLVDE